MKIIIKMQTRWNGEVLRPGDEADIESATAHRWIDRGIAEPVEADAVSPSISDTSEPEESLEDLKYNKLRKVAGERGITVPRGIKKPELIALIRGEATELKPAPTDEKKTDD